MSIIAKVKLFDIGACNILGMIGDNVIRLRCNHEGVENSAVVSAIGPIFKAWVKDLADTLPRTGHVLTHMAYQHCLVLTHLLDPSRQANDVLSAATRAAGLLSEHPNITGPLVHHVLVLAILCLDALAAGPPVTRDLAREAMQQLCQAPFAPRQCKEPIIALLGDGRRPLASHGRDIGQDDVDVSIEHPVDDGGRWSFPGFDPRPILITGYMSYFRKILRPVLPPTFGG